MSPPLRTRSKPLRTYGKRSASVPEERGEAPLKRRRTEIGDTVLSSLATVTSNSDLPTPSPRSEKRNDGATNSTTTGDTSLKPIKKGSIMNYFKPLPVSSPLASSCPNSDEVRPNSTPPSSPPPTVPKARRKPRLLRFRGGSMPDISTEDMDEEIEKGLETSKHEGGRQKCSPEHDDREEEESTRPPLHERRSSLSNQESGQESVIPGKEKKFSRSKSAPTVQTTLNISAQAAFSECKVCNTVWNPLHPGDVKFHLKQHAAVLRAKKKSEQNEL